MRVANFSAEVSPFAKTGGLGDVVSSLPKAIAATGHDVDVWVPFFLEAAEWFRRRGTWPEQEVVRGTLADIAEKAAHIKKTALILVGDFLRESDKRSKLYDPAFAHACREAETP